METKEKQFIDEFKTYLSVEKNFSEHTLTAYCSDIVSFILWLDGLSVTVCKSPSCIGNTTPPKATFRAECASLNWLNSPL